jgi:transposase-like protein
MEWVKGVEDLDIRIFRAQGIVGVGVFTRTFTAWFLAVASAKTAPVGSPVENPSPVKVLSRLFRKKFLIYLEKAFQKDKLGFHGELEPSAKPAVFATFCRRAGQREWVVYAKRPFGGPELVLKYLARYTHRVAISNSRLLSLEDGRVTFDGKDYADGHQSCDELDAVEFIRRFLLHVLPSGFVRIRHFGFLANRGRRKNVALCRSLLAAQGLAKGATTMSQTGEKSESPEQESTLCPICKIGRLICIEIVKPGELPTPVLPTQDTS